MNTSYFDHLQDFKSGHLKLVDLRSPGEFKLGAMPFAVNLPLFTDEERAEIGTTYKQVGQNEAMHLGLEIFATKIDSFLHQLDHLAGPGRRLALHCWRGGLRSGSVAKLLETIGIKPILITGGYKKYRSEVLSLIDALSKHRLLVLNGRTGSGKTQIIQQLIEMGAPAIDLEGLASHRGSALGNLNIPSPQPSQQNFENLLAVHYFSVRHAPTVILEIEQNIGEIQMPAPLRNHICSSEMILIERSLEDRISHIEKEYVGKWTDDTDVMFTKAMEHLKKHLQGPIFQQIKDNVRERNFSEAIKLLIIHRYDKCYDKAIKRQAGHIKETINLSPSLADATNRILNLVQFGASRPNPNCAF